MTSRTIEHDHDRRRPGVLHALEELKFSAHRVLIAGTREDGQSTVDACDNASLNLSRMEGRDEFEVPLVPEDGRIPENCIRAEAVACETESATHAEVERRALRRVLYLGQKAPHITGPVRESQDGVDAVPLELADLLARVEADETKGCKLDMSIDRQTDGQTDGQMGASQ